MIEGCSNGLNGDAVKHLVTKCFLDAISHTAAGKILQQQVAASIQKTEPDLTVCFNTQSECLRRKGRGQGK